MMNRLLPSILVLCIFLAPAMTRAQAGAAYDRRATELISRGAYIDALEYLNLTLRTDPGSAGLWFLRGYAKYGLDDFIGAELDYGQAISLSPYMADFYTNRAVVRSRLENYKGAMEDYDRALALDGKNAEIWYNRARTNLLLKKHYSCIVDCNTALRLGFGREEVYILRAAAESEIRRYDDALADLDKALAIQPDNAAVHTQRGLVREEEGKPDSAIADFSRAIAADSSYGYAWFNRALSRIKTGDHRGAEKDLDRVISLSPYNSYAWYNRAIARIGLGDRKGAIGDFDIVSKLDPKNLVSCYYRSRLKRELGDYAGALADLDRAIELLPDYTDAWYDRYEIKLKLGDKKGARADYAKALELGRRHTADSDSLGPGKKDYLKSLVKLSGDFEAMNTPAAKIQNQPVDIQLRPMYSLLLWKADFGKVRLYDAYGKAHYHDNILIMTGEADIPGDSILLAEVHRQTRHLDSAGPSAERWFRRGVAFYHLNSFGQALQDLDAALATDSCHIEALFCRALARYQRIRQISAEEEVMPGILPDRSAGQAESRPSSGGIEHTFEAVLRDIDRVTALDPSFAFAWFNRGFVNSQMGNYRQAIADFSKSAALRKDFAEAFYNRGLISILLQDNHAGCLDLSRSGELGIPDAYRVMKRHCYK